MSTTRNMTQKRLMKEFKELTLNPAEGIVAGPISEDNLFEWEALVTGPEGTPYDGGCFAARISFPKDYPMNPPTMVFTSQIWHPNVFNSGRVCISILHSATDEMYRGYEPASEQWSPLLSLETILLSVVSMFNEPNPQSPANVDAAKQWRDDQEGFKKKVFECVKRSVGL